MSHIQKQKEMMSSDLKKNLIGHFNIDKLGLKESVLFEKNYSVKPLIKL